MINADLLACLVYSGSIPGTSPLFKVQVQKVVKTADGLKWYGTIPVGS